ncbi:MAG TPA: metallophosphoesterase [Leptolyngbyaceae cyanobacterium M33_DOE_097]|uniref:Metallophosphoesterase n=1 Tax=Oscillatoriales cyanobacterium SpSt-418 TaxID=2282169 RepID=A0A7C3PT94_9CYAN|nr:metallophosphoesterase [Leptolyngbyaceae cyanobacterium M33_DOE_097]
MRFSLSRFLARFFVALCLVGVLYACRASSPQANAPSSPTEQTAIAQTTSAQLPPAAQALVDQSQGGLFNPPRGDVRFVVISDLNDAYGSTDYSREVDQGIALLPLWQPDMVLCSGDMVAGQSPTLTPDQLKAMWAAFDDHVAAPLRQAKIPYGFTIGNHDASAALGVKGNFLFQRERDIASDYWRDPAHNPGVKFIDQEDYPFFFTFEYQDIFFMAWDGSSNNIPPEKLAWVEKSLASEKAQSAKLRILLGHLPLYAVAVGRNEPAEVMQNADQLRSLLEKYKVHTYISGHHHAYYPAHRGGLQLLHMGILGSGPRPLVDFPKPPRKAITVMDVKFDSPELTTYTTFDMKTLKQIKNEELPRFLLGHNGITLRRDVEWNALTAQEKAACVNRLGAKRCTA